MLILEYCEMGTLKDQIKYFREVRQQYFSENQIMDIFIQTLRGLKHIHDKGYLHRDIKPENLLVTQNLRIKISDAGISSRCSHNEEETT